MLVSAISNSGSEIPRERNMILARVKTSNYLITGMRSSEDFKLARIQKLTFLNFYYNHLPGTTPWITKGWCSIINSRTGKKLNLWGLTSESGETPILKNDSAELQKLKSINFLNSCQTHGNGSKIPVQYTGQTVHHLGNFRNLLHANPELTSPRKRVKHLFYKGANF